MVVVVVNNILGGVDKLDKKRREWSGEEWRGDGNSLFYTTSLMKAKNNALITFPTTLSATFSSIHASLFMISFSVEGQQCCQMRSSHNPTNSNDSVCSVN